MQMFLKLEAQTQREVGRIITPKAPDREGRKADGNSHLASNKSVFYEDCKGRRVEYMQDEGHEEGRQKPEREGRAKDKRQTKRPIDDGETDDSGSEEDQRWKRECNCDTFFPVAVGAGIVSDTRYSIAVCAGRYSTAVCAGKPLRRRRGEEEELRGQCDEDEEEEGDRKNPEAVRAGNTVAVGAGMRTQEEREAIVAEMRGRGRRETPRAVGAGTPVAVGAGRSETPQLAVDAGSPKCMRRRAKAKTMTTMMLEVPMEAGKAGDMQQMRSAPSLEVGAMVVEICRLPLGNGSGCIESRGRQKSQGTQKMSKTIGRPKEKF